jgi:5-methylcytosine-specific restriction enzyme A
MSWQLACVLPMALMPVRPGAACKRSGCRGIVRNGVCSVCGPLHKERRRLHDEQRGTAAQRGYDGRWQRVRAAYLRAHPLCADCLDRGAVTPATDVHHVIPRRDGGEDVESNLRALCHSCHSKVTSAGG